MSEATDSAISQETVNEAAKAMWRLEALFDEALLVTGRLAHSMLTAQAEGGLSPMCMHRDFFAKLPALNHAIIAGRSAAIDVHKGMGSVGQQLGLEVRMDDSPPMKKWPDIMPWPTGQAQAAVPAEPAQVLPLQRRAG